MAMLGKNIMGAKEIIIIIRIIISELAVCTV